MQSQFKYLALLLVLSFCKAGLQAQTVDWRDLQNGWQTPDENYADQPYFVILEDGGWLMTLTTGPGAEGGDGQHVVSTKSADNGQTWTPLLDIEATGSALPAPDTGILSSWVVPYQSGYRAPGATCNRVYAIYTWGDPYVTSPPVPRRDTHGPYAFRYTDDGGANWSARHIIPYTNTDQDNSNHFSGATPAGWNVDKPLRLNGKMFFSFTKLHAPFSAGSQQGQGYIYRCDNIDTEGDPAALAWKMLPGTVNPDDSVDTAALGIRRFDWGSEQEEFDLQELTSGALLLTYRTTRGWIGETVSTDEGQTWTEPVERRYHLDGRLVRHPRANCKVWRLTSGKYLMWHHNNGTTSFENRNPVWVSIGTQAGNAISWGEPEIFLYHRSKAKRISYPDMMEVGGAMYVTETEKGVSRVHPIDASFLAALDTQPSRSTKTTSDLQLEQTGSLSGSFTMPTLPNLTGYNPHGFTIETQFQTSSLGAGQTVFDTFSGGSGVRMTVSSVGAVDFDMSDGTRSVALRSDTGTVVAGQRTHISVHVDAAAKTITMVANGRVCDGTNHNTGTGDRNFGWIHFDDNFAGVNGGDIEVGSGLAGTVDLLRVYDRALLHTEAIGNWRNAAGVSGPAVSAGIISSATLPEPGESVTFDASHSYVSELTNPVYTWDFGDGSPTVQGATVNHTFAATGNNAVTMTISEPGTSNLQGQPVAQLDLEVAVPSATAVITAARPPGSKTVTFSAVSSTLTNLPDPIYNWDFGDGNTGIGSTIEHTYAAAGDYTVGLEITRSGGGPVGGSPIASESVNAGGSTPLGKILSIEHDGTAGDEGNPFDTNILSQGTDWTYTTDGARTVMTALDNGSSGNNRLTLIGADDVTEFNADGGPDGKGWVFEIELELLQGVAKSGGGFAYFGVRSENEAGRQAWIGLSEAGGAGGRGQVGFVNGSSSNFIGTPADLDIDSLVGDGEYHNFKIHKHDKEGTTTVDVFMDGALVLSTPYSFLLNSIAATDIQGFATSTPTPLSEANIDFIRFSLFDNLIESAPAADSTAPVLQSTDPANGVSGVSPTTNLVATFDELISLGTSGDVTITNLSNPSDTVISLGGADSDGSITASGNQLIINPAADLAAGDEFAVQIGSSVVEDAFGNTFAHTTPWGFTISDDPVPPAVLVDINADGTNRDATPAHFEAAAGLAAGTFNGDSVTHFPNNNPSGSPFNQTVDDITVEVSDFTSDADNWFGSGSDNNLLDDGLYHRNSSADPTATITLSGSGLDLASNRRYELYLFAGRSQGHETTFKFDDDDPQDPTGGVTIDVDPPVVGGDNTLGTALFTFETGSTPPASLVVRWDGSRHNNGNQDAVFSGFALRDIGPVTPPNTFVNWITGFGLNPGDRDFTDDPDGDRLANGLEAWFGTDPGQFNAGLAGLTSNGTTTTFSHPQSENPPVDVTGFYEWSLDLSHWYAGDGSEGPAGGPTVDITGAVVGSTTTATAVASEALEQVFLRAAVVQESH